jgi:signal transduction histidine kinase
VLLVLHVVDNMSLVIARKRAQRIAALLYFDLRRQTKIATVVYELLQNAYSCTGEAIVEYCFSQYFSQRTFKIKITDKGSRISHEDMENPKKLMDKFVIDTSVHGTEVITEKNLPSNAPFITKGHLDKISQEVRLNDSVSVFEEIQRLNKELLHVFSTRSKLQEDVEKLAHAEKINSMGEMATTLAHELNQPLATITTYIQGSIRHLKNNIFKKNELLQVLKLAVKETKRAGNFVHRVKDFVHAEELSKEKTNINQVISETLLLVEPDIIKYHAKINVELNECLPTVFIDPIQIKQAFVNVIRSSLQAMKRAKTQSPQLIMKSCLTENDEIAIDILDNGPDFTLLNLRQLFEPHLTTKKKGLDMQLAIARSIIEAHGGRLRAQPHSGCGVCFHGILPIKAEKKE